MPVPVHAPPQPPKVEPAAGVAVRVTGVPLSYEAEQFPPQLILGGFSEEVTVPSPSPWRITERVKPPPPAGDTVSTVLPLRPPEVAVIVVDPALRAVAKPFASTVATFSSLLVHVTPSPTTVTGVKALSASVLRVPSPSRPKRARPQHCTVPPARSAQLCSAPDVVAIAVVIPVISAVGGLEMVSLGLPLPFWPKLLSPQQSTLASGRSTQVCSAPGARAAAATPLPATGVEEALMAVWFPSWKKSFHPQQRIVPSRRITQVWKMPDSRATAVLIPMTSTGLGGGLGIGGRGCGGVAAALPRRAHAFLPPERAVPVCRGAKEVYPPAGKARGLALELEV